MFIFIPILFMFLFLLFSFLFNKNFFVALDLKTPFECGFDNSQTFRSYFSLRFFNLTVVFLLFDLEIVFILPLPLLFTDCKFLFFYIYMFILIGTYLEWNQGSFNWK